VRANQVAIDDQSIVWTQDADAAQLMTMQPKLQYSYIIKWTW
jgi:streptogramin lyase